MKVSSLLALVRICAGRTSAFAWDGFGHMIVAAIAYEKLTKHCLLGRVTRSTT
jgi:hypothetical protein